jgi:hypothetical protein
VASQTRPSASEDERRHKIRTLVVASAASATAAVVISQFWIAGTWMAAALTPVLVTLISEMLHKPTAVIASRLTTEKDAILPEAGGAGRPPRRADEALPRRAPAEPGSREAEPAEPPIRVYRTGDGGPARPRARKKIAVGAIAATAATAFAITAIAMTGTELVTGGSIGKGSHKTTLLGGGKDSTKDKEQDTTTTPSDEQDQQQTAPQKEQTTPQDQQTTPKTQPQQTTPQGQPQQTTPVPTPQVPPTTTTP